MNEQKTFAKWLLNYVKTHPDSCMIMERGPFGEFTMRIRHTSKGRPIVSKCSLPGIEYEQSELTIDEIFIYAAEDLERRYKTMESNLKEVRFDKWCTSCKHYTHKFPKEDFSFEAQEPCCSCLDAENAMREGSEKPEYWEAK